VRRRGGLAAALALVALLAAALLATRGGDEENEPVRYPTAPENASVARVERVVDGDTIRLAGIGPVRLIGIDTPETYGGRVECFGPEATRYVRGLLPRGARVRYTVGEEPRDRFGRLLVYLYMPDGAALNYVLVTAGYATALTIPPNDRYARVFERTERAARRARSGMWGEGGCGG
jgi:micrococcal nuclease